MKGLKKQYLLDPNIIFLNHGSYGACPKPVFDRFQQIQREMELNPVDFLGRRSAKLLRNSREKLAEFLGTTASNLVYLNNATTAVNTVIRSMNLRPGDEILTTNHEYGACDLAWEQTCKREGARYVKHHIRLPIEDNETITNSLIGSVTSRTKMIFISHITSSCAIILPVENICKKARALGIPVFIDGAHVPGQLPLNLDSLDVDFYTGNCHKWLSSPKNAAFLYARPERQADLEAVVVSWGYSNPFDSHTGYVGEELFERRHQWQGTKDIAACLAVPSAINFQETNNWDSVRADCHHLATETRDRINDLTGLEDIAPNESFGQMIAAALPNCDPAALKIDLFEKYKIEIPITDLSKRLFVRPSFNAYNSRADADALVEALKELIGE